MVGPEKISDPDPYSGPVRAHLAVVAFLVYDLQPSPACREIEEIT